MAFAPIRAGTFLIAFYTGSVIFEFPWHPHQLVSVSFFCHSLRSRYLTIYKRLF
jgi:hypothetical protein